MPQGDTQNGAARQVGEALAREDTAKAAAWVTTLKPEARAEAAIGVIDLMSSKDITGTAQWVSSLAGEKGRGLRERGRNHIACKVAPEVAGFPECKNDQAHERRDRQEPRRNGNSA